MRVTLSPSETGLSMIKQMHHPHHHHQQHPLIHQSSMQHQPIMGCFNQTANAYVSQVPLSSIDAAAAQQYLFDPSGILY
jgi:hypothetical protein